MNPQTMAMAIQCPVCAAPPGTMCNVPTDTGRRYVQWFHMMREDRANEMLAALPRPEPED
jgi:hypothetical protein